MKAERRHELKQNTLVRGIGNIPNRWQDYGPKVLLAAVLVALGIFLVRYRLNNAAEQQGKAKQDLAVAQEMVGRLRQLQAAPPTMDAEQLVVARQDAFSTGAKSIDAVLSEAGEKETAIRAQALVAKGDMNWILANTPPPAAAATQPSLQLAQSPDEMLRNAEDAYSTVIAKYPNELIGTAAARFGLAAVAENRKDWDKARSYYQSVLDDKDSPQVFKDLSTAHLKQLDDLPKPLYVGEFAAPATAPSNGPVSIMPQIEAALPAATQTLGPAFPGAATLPATAAPSTAPTTQP